MAGFPYNYNNNLPSGWEEKVSSDGRVFYLDHNTKKSQWNHPITKRRKRVVAGIPPGWEKLETEGEQTKFIFRAKNIITYIDPRLSIVVEDKEYEEDTKLAEAELNSNAPPAYKKAVEVPEFVNPFTTNPFTRNPEKSLSPGKMGRFDAPFPKNSSNYGDRYRDVGNYQSNRDNRNDYSNSRFDVNNSRNQGGWSGASSRFGNQDQDRNFSNRGMKNDRSGYETNSGNGSQGGDYGSMPNQRNWNESASNQNPRYGNQQGFSGYPPSQESRSEPGYSNYKSDSCLAGAGDRGRNNNNDYFSASKNNPLGKGNDYSSNRDKWNEPVFSSSKSDNQFIKNDGSFSKGRMDTEHYSNSRIDPPDKERGYPRQEMEGYGSRPNQGFRNESRDYFQRRDSREDRQRDFPPDRNFDKRNDTYDQGSYGRFGPSKNDSRESTWSGSLPRDRESNRSYQSEGQYSEFKNNPELGSRDREFTRPYQSEGQYSAFQNNPELGSRDREFSRPYQSEGQYSEFKNNPELGSRDREFTRPYQSEGQYSEFKNNPESLKRPFESRGAQREEGPPKKMYGSEYSEGRQGEYPDQTYTGKPDPYSYEGTSNIQGDSIIGSDPKFSRPGNNDDSQPSSDDAESHEEDEHSDDEDSDADDNEDSNDDYEEIQNEGGADDTPGPSTLEQKKKRSKKLTFKKNAIECKMYTVAIAPVGFPKFNSLSRWQAEEVKDIIIRKIENLNPSDEISPRFAQTRYRVGVLLVTCLDQRSKQWLSKTVNFVRLSDGTELNICSPKSARNSAIICGIFPTDYHGEEVFLRKLADENPRIDISRWTVLQQFPMNGGICVSIGAPKTVVGDLDMIKYMISFNSNPVKMGVVSKKNSGRTAPRGKLRKFIEEMIVGF